MYKVSIPTYVAPYLESLNPGEVHGEGGDCKNPKCDYIHTPEDKKEMNWAEGWYTCPKCDYSYNYATGPYDYAGARTRSGLTPTQMGNIGEQLIQDMIDIPGVGPVMWKHEEINDPLDFIIGKYGVEVKTNHSEAQPRFKLGDAHERAAKLQKAHDYGLTPALMGVRLNFYRNYADLFFRPQMSDSWIGQPGLEHVAKVGFEYLNPFKDPAQVPVPNDLPEDDSSLSRSYL